MSSISKIGKLADLLVEVTSYCANSALIRLPDSDTYGTIRRPQMVARFAGHFSEQLFQDQGSWHSAARRLMISCEPGAGPVK
jgi:hypothetical protein